MKTTRALVMKSMFGWFAGAVPACVEADQYESSQGGNEESTDDETSGPGDSAESSDQTDTDPMDEPGGLCPDVVPGPAEIGDPCEQNLDCETWVCEELESYPATLGVCGVPPDACRTRFTGSVLDFVRGTPMGGVDIEVVSATAILDPENTPAILDGKTDETGQFDITTNEPLSDIFGYLGRMHIGGRYPSLTGVIGPADKAGTYPPFAGVHEWWAIAESDVADWSAALADDKEIAEDLPLQDHNVLYGIVRNAGHPSNRVAGAAVVPVADNSSLIVRYLSDDGAFNAEATQSSGIFLLFDAGPGEAITIEIPGGSLANPDGARCGMSNGALWNMTLDVQFE